MFSLPLVLTSKLCTVQVELISVANVVYRIIMFARQYYNIARGKEPRVSVQVQFFNI